MNSSMLFSGWEIECSSEASTIGRLNNCVAMNIFEVNRNGGYF